MRILLVLAIVLAAAAPARAATAGLAPASGAAGTKAFLWADGLPPHTPVELQVGGRPRLVFADARGRLATAAVIPADAPEAVPVELRAAGRSATLMYRLRSPWAARRSVAVADWQGHGLRTSADLDRGVLRVRADLAGLTAGDEAVAVTGGRELGRATVREDGSATVRGVVRGGAVGALLLASSGPVRLGARLPAPPAVLAAVGDIACAPHEPVTETLCRHAQTAAVAARFRPDSAALLGDIQYESGTLSAFRSSFGRSWGQLPMPLRPVPGNHEYRTPGAAGYFEYFAEQARWRPPPWYAYDLGPWHVIALNSNCEVVACGAGSEQERWLRAELAAHPGGCTLAYWHHPRYSSGFHGSDPRTAPFWRALQQAGAELVLAGHDHDYERFAPQDASGLADETGMRSFVVGTGGKDLTALREPRAPNSELARDDQPGVLILRLYPGAYSWRFVDVAGRTLDFGNGSCI